jgi:hypothetical protein
MAYIKIRKQSDGSTRYTAIVRLRRGKTIVHQEARTFAHRVLELSGSRPPSALARLADEAQLRARIACLLDDLGSRIRSQERGR